jgi:hypothetical protein
MPRATAGNSLDSTSNALLYEGANISQLCVLFKCDDRTLKERMHGLGPVGKRSNAPIYSVAEVAARMGRLTEEQVDARIRRMNHADLPKALTKEFWAGLRSKQEYELRAGDLWPTDKVISEVGEMVKLLKMELDLLTDAIERQTEMTAKQRDLAQSLVEGAKQNMLKRLREKFAVRPVAVVAEDDDEL